MATSLDVAEEPIPTSTVLISVSKGENFKFNNCKKDDLNLEKCLEKGRHVTCSVLLLVIDDKTKQGAVVAHPVELEKVFFVAEEQGWSVPLFVTMPAQRSNEDQAVRISKSIFVTNFPDNLGSKELWKVCEGYGKVIDVFIPNRRSKAGVILLVLYASNAYNDFVSDEVLFGWTSEGIPLHVGSRVRFDKIGYKWGEFSVTNGGYELYVEWSWVRDASTSLSHPPGFTPKTSVTHANVGEICEDGTTNGEDMVNMPRVDAKVHGPFKEDMDKDLVRLSMLLVHGVLISLLCLLLCGLDVTCTISSYSFEGKFRLDFGPTPFRFYQILVKDGGFDSMVEQRGCLFRILIPIADG
ncbi:RNA-directed DNA polymerase, eukaryota [Tanacetum coccineum]